MASSIPEYYRHLAEERKKEVPEVDLESAVPAPGRAPRPRGAARVAAAPRPAPPEPPSTPFRAHRFGVKLYEGWQDKTIYFLAGPVSDGVQHNVVVTLDEEAGELALRDYADVQVRAIEDSLKGLTVLLKEPIQLDNGLPAYRVIYSWYPKPDLRYYQQQVYVLHERVAYKLTATFTKKTRRTLGPQVERIMLSFEPAPPPRA